MGTIDRVKFSSDLVRLSCEISSLCNTVVGIGGLQKLACRVSVDGKGWLHLGLLICLNLFSQFKTIASSEEC